GAKKFKPPKPPRQPGKRPDRIKWPAGGALCRINPRGHCAVARSTRQDRSGTRAPERSLPSPGLHPCVRAARGAVGASCPSLPHLGKPSSSAWLPLHPKGTNQWAAAAAAGGGGGPGRREPGNLEGARVVVGEEERWRLAPDKSEGDCCGGRRRRRDHFLGCDHDS
ncbi:hypothetical protein PVAP13_9NG226946, partial [Panicum virgatum]